MRAIPSLIFSFFAFFMTGFEQSAGQFFIFFITIFMATIFGSALCFFISAVTDMFGKYIYKLSTIGYESFVLSLLACFSSSLCLFHIFPTIHIKSHTSEKRKEKKGGKNSKYR